MFRKIGGARLEGDSQWYQGNGLNLTIWQPAGYPPSGFEIEFLHERGSRVLRWSRRQGLSHYLVDDGESRPGHYKASPLLQPGSPAPLAQLCQNLRQQAGEVSPAVIDFICDTLSADS